VSDWNFDMLAAIADPRSEMGVVVAAHASDGAPPIVGEAFYNPASNGGEWWWANTSDGEYHACSIDETYGPPFAWQPLPDPPTPRPTTNEGDPA